jgi:hypothetical protein
MLLRHQVKTAIEAWLPMQAANPCLRLQLAYSEAWITTAGYSGLPESAYQIDFVYVGKPA